MDNDYGLEFCLWRVWLLLYDHLVILLHALQEKSRIHTEREDFLKICHIMVKKGELADREWVDWVLRVLISNFGAQIIYFNHWTMEVLQKVDNVWLPISIHSFEAFGRESTCNNTVSDVSQIKIILSRLKTLFVCWYDGTNPITWTAWAASAFNFLVFARLVRSSNYSFVSLSFHRLIIICTRGSLVLVPRALQNFSCSLLFIIFSLDLLLIPDTLSIRVVNQL